MTVARQRLKRSTNEIARLRVAWSELEGTARYLRPLTRRDTIFPGVLPTAQASLRWSTTNPPLTNFPAELRDGTEDLPGRLIRDPWTSGITLPWPGTWWLKWDLDAVEARIEALLSEDEAALEAYRLGHDVHTLTACALFDLPMAPVRDKTIHTDGGAAAQWRAAVRWTGSEDRRRHVAKTVRYALTYSPDERGILESMELIATMGRDAALQFARRYLASRPALQRMKRLVGDMIAASGVARTGFGHPRHVYRQPARPPMDDGTRSMRKEGIAHTISGTVSQMGNLVAIRTQAMYPDAYIVRNDHDSQTWAFPVAVAIDTVLGTLKPAVEGPWLFPQWPHIPAFRFPASWYRYTDDGGRAKI